MGLSACEMKLTAGQRQGGVSMQCLRALVWPVLESFAPDEEEFALKHACLAGLGLLLTYGEIKVPVIMGVPAWWAESI